MRAHLYFRSEGSNEYNHSRDGPDLLLSLAYKPRRTKSLFRYHAKFECKLVTSRRICHGELLCHFACAMQTCREISPNKKLHGNMAASKIGRHQVRLAGFSWRGDMLPLKRASIFRVIYLALDCCCKAWMTSSKITTHMLREQLQTPLTTKAGCEECTYWQRIFWCDIFGDLKGCSSSNQNSCCERRSASQIFSQGAGRPHKNQSP